MVKRVRLDEQHLLLAALPPTNGQYRVAFSIIAAFVIVFVFAIPFANTPLVRLDVWVPVFTTALLFTDLVTSVLLYSQFSITQDRALLVLATGYLFSALIVVPYALTFPGVFSPTGLFGADLQTAVWFYIIWHIVSPWSVILYELFKNTSESRRTLRNSMTLEIGFCVVLAIAVVCILVWFLTAKHDLLPLIYVDRTSLSPLAKAAAGAIILSCTIALTLLWMRRSSVLDLWLSVTVTAWLLEITLNGLILTDRFSLGWYVGRIYALIAGSVVLILLLSETTRLYAHLARSVIRQRAARQARQISMNTLAASIGHEVNQPLGAISLNTETALLLLSRTPPDHDEIRATLQDIAAAAARGGQVVAGLRTMFKKGAHGRDLFDANDLMREVLGMLDMDLRAQRVAVAAELKEGLPPLRADRGQLQQVFLNLATNAIEAMRPLTDRARKLRVTSDVTEDSSEIRITIEDTGAGIDGKDKDRVFEPFYTTKSVGTGIGLTICRSIIDSHGGSLRTSANHPYGAIFEVVVPVEPGMSG